MRKELIKAVRKLFEVGMKAQLPNFVPFKMVEKGASALAPSVGGIAGKSRRLVVFRGS